ncbi:phage tail tape measure protein [Streptomyces sp. NPDC087437]|uniref:phage tail tape measure protein n=1 Tax=Streptomyces sp. NPDC087437 TaxID=3365789 RepID=UPI003820CE6C
MAERTVRVRVVADLAGFGALRGAAAQLTGFGRQAGLAGAGVRGLTTATGGARRGLTAVGAGARGGAAGLAGVTTAAGSARRGLSGVTTTASGLPAVFGRIGSAARSGLSSAASATSALLAPVRGLGTLLAGGAIVYGLADVVHQGNDYSSALYKFGEVTRASGAEMAAAGREAQALGADIRLPAATAAGAAEAMTELAKAGLSASDSMRAAKGTLQLSAAARTDVAMAARIEGDIMDQFAMKGSQASTVADTLANTVNNASGELIDLYYAMKYVGPTAHSMGVSIQDAATTVGLLGKSGIIGETAGTTLRGMLSRMAAPTRQAKQGLKELGIEAFDASGKFKGMEYVVGKLADAHHHLSQKAFTSAAAMAFGKPALSGATALAHQGAKAYGILHNQISRVGGAADIAAAEAKGLGGAMRTMGAQVKGFFLQVYTGVSPVLERITRGMADSVAAGIPYVRRGVAVAGALWDLYGPTVERKLDSVGGRVRRQAVKMVDPLVGVLKTGLAVAAPIATGTLYGLWTILQNIGHAVGPLVDGLAAVVSSVQSGTGALGILGGVLGGTIGLLSHATDVLGPLASLVGGLGKAFGALPGPIQLALLSMLAMRAARGPIDGLRTSVTAYGRAGVQAFRGIGDAVLYQRVLAAGAGKELGRFGGFVAELERRSPAIARMGTAFRTTAGQIQAAGGRAAGFRSVLGGIGAAAGSGALSGLKGLVGFLGGPWGVAMAGAMLGLSFLAKKQQEAAAAAAAHQQRVSDLTKALQDSNGAVNGSIRAAAAQTLQDTKLKDGKTKLVDVMREAGVSLTQLTDAYTSQSGGLEKLRKGLLQTAEAHTKVQSAGTSYAQGWDEEGLAAARAADALGSLSGELPEALRRQKELAAAVKGGGEAALDATNPTGRLKDAISTLAKSTSDADTKARALHDALNLLAGGELEVQAAVAQLNGEIASLKDTWSDGVDRNKGFGKNLDDLDRSLIAIDGSLNTTTENGRTLFDRLQQLNSGAAGAAQKTYDLARANNEAAGPALAKAEKHMESAWQAAVKAATEFGLTRDQAMELANSMGFIPSSLAITLSTPGLDETQKDLLYVQGLAGHMPKDSKVRVSALTEDATKMLTQLGFKIEKLPGGRQVEITAPTEKASKDLDALIAKKLPAKEVPVSAKTQAAMNDLQVLQAKIGSTKGKDIPMKALTGDAEKALKELGFKVTHMKDGTVKVTIPTGPPKAAIDYIQGAINNMSGKTLGIGVYTTEYHKKVEQGSNVPPMLARRNEDGSVTDYYAQGGVRENHVAQIAPAGAMRVWAERETGGEAYLPLSPSKRGRSTKILEEVARRFGYRLEKYAQGGITAFASGGFTYTPTEPMSTLGAGSGMDRYQAAVQRLKDAWAKLAEAEKKAASGSKAYKDAQKKEAQTRKDSARRVSQAEENLARVRKGKHTAKQLADAEHRLANARAAASKSNKAAADRTEKARKSAVANSKDVAAARKKVYAADAELGLKKGAKAPSGFDLKGYQLQLEKASKANATWEKNLAKIGSKAGEDVADILRGMGEEGRDLVNALASASTTQFNAIVKNLKALAPTAKATLADYTKQLNNANKVGSDFQKNLLKLASMGYTDLAMQLAAQGDDAAQAVAAAAVQNKTSAAAADKAAKANAALLSSEDLSNAMTLLGVLRSKPGAGIADVIAAGLDWATIRSLAPKIASEIKAVSGSGTFVEQLKGQNIAMAKGGILPDSSYTVLAGERGTGGEAYIPLGAGNRGRSTALLSSVAGQFGYSLTPLRGGGGQTVVQHITKHYTVQLDGAKQTTGEQLADINRHMAFVS